MKRESIEHKATRRLDMIGAALSDHAHEWTREERRAFDYLARFIAKYAPKEKP